MDEHQLAAGAVVLGYYLDPIPLLFFPGTTVTIRKWKSEWVCGLDSERKTEKNMIFQKSLEFCLPGHLAYTSAMDEADPKLKEWGFLLTKTCLWPDIL